MAGNIHYGVLLPVRQLPNPFISVIGPLLPGDEAFHRAGHSRAPQQLPLHGRSP